MAEPTSNLTATRDVASAVTPVPVSRWAIHRRMYDWVFSFSESRHAVLALFCISLAECSFFPIPPDVLMIPMILKQRRKTWWYATVALLASIPGALLGYWIGYELTGVAEWLIGVEHLTKVQDYVNQYGFWGMFVGAVLISPFKVVTIAAGFAKMNLFWFVLACTLGRAKRLYVVAAVAWFVGPKALPIIEKYFNTFCLALAVLAIGAIVAVKYWH
ncbi:MAG: YqaA family protein [Phycisphaerales bacterium]